MVLPLDPELAQFVYVACSRDPHESDSQDFMGSFSTWVLVVPNSCSLTCVTNSSPLNHLPRSRSKCAVKGERITDGLFMLLGKIAYHPLDISAKISKLRFYELVDCVVADPK